MEQAIKQINKQKKHKKKARECSEIWQYGEENCFIDDGFYVFILLPQFGSTCIGLIRVCIGERGRKEEREREKEREQVCR